MATDYPDILAEYASANQRYQVDGLQYVGGIMPPRFGSGETVNLELFLQNVVNVPIKVAISLDMPQSGRLRPKPMLQSNASQTQLTLAVGEVGRLLLPITTTEQTKPGRYEVELAVKVAAASKNPEFVRKPRDKDVLSALPLDDFVGLDLARTVGVFYKTSNGKKAEFSLEVSPEPVGVDPDDVVTEQKYEQLWQPSDADLQHKAQIEFNKVRVNVLNELDMEPLFVALYAESKSRIADVGLTLRPGESILLAKILTYTAMSFLKNGALQDGLLCPIWERALALDYPTDNPIELVTTLGYSQIYRLATAFSFTLIAKVAGKQPWTLAERRGVTAYLADTIENGHPLDPDFLYLPLLFGGLAVAGKVRFPDEDVAQTLELAKLARRARPSVFTAPEMEDADKIYAKMLHSIKA